MRIAEWRIKLKEKLAQLRKIPQDILLVAILILACLASFGFGYAAGKDADLSAQEGQGSNNVAIIPSPLVATTSGQVVASKSGTKYYLPWCAGADRISSANKVWFDSAQSAAMQGYFPAANCKGL